MSIASRLIRGFNNSMINEDSTESQRSLNTSDDNWKVVKDAIYKYKQFLEKAKSIPDNILNGLSSKPLAYTENPIHDVIDEISYLGKCIEQSIRSIQELNENPTNKYRKLDLEFRFKDIEKAINDCNKEFNKNIYVK